MNHYDSHHRDPEFHMEHLAELNVIPKEEFVERNQLENYLSKIKDKIQSYIDKLEVKDLTGNPEGCDKQANLISP